MRDAAAAAGNAATQAGNTGAGLSAGASTIGSQLIPYLSRQLQNPSGYSQQDLGAQLAASQGGAGGATSGLAGAASKNAATSRNPMGFSSALDAAARDRSKAAAGSSEQIAANNANLKQQQQSQAASGLQGLYGTDVSGANAATGQIAPDVNAEVNASNSGWLQNLTGIMNSISGAATGAAGVKKAFG